MVRVAQLKPRAPKATISQREVFAREYVIDLNATQAVLRAGYKCKDMRAAADKANHLLQDPAVVALIQDLKAKQFSRLEIKADRVLMELARMAYLDPGELAKAGVNSPADIAALPEDVRRAISGWKWDAEGNFVVQWSPKQAALEALGRHLKLFVDRVEVKEVGGLAERLARARARVAQAQQPAGDPAHPVPG